MPDQWLEEARELLDKLAPVVNRRYADALLRQYVRTTDEEEKELIRKNFDRLLAARRPILLTSRRPILAVPDEQTAAGEIVLGKVMWGEKTLYPFGTSLEELNRHVLITAQSGAGKTTLIARLIAELIRLGKPFLVTDFKRDYRHLTRQFPQLLVVNWKVLRVNPLRPPPGVPVQEWKQQLVHIFGYVEGVWKGSTQYMLQKLDEVYTEKGDSATLRDLYDKVVEATNEPNRKLQEYWAVIHTRLYGLLSKLGDTINGAQWLDVAKLLDYPVVLELDGLDREDANFLLLWLFYWIYAYRKAQNQRGRLLHVLIIDEAKRVFTGSEMYSSTTSEYSGTPPADLICDEIRDYGEAIIAADQEPTKLSQSLKANTYTKLTGNLGEGRDIWDISQSMNLKDEEVDAIPKLERGEWLVKLSGRYTSPFLIKTEDFPLEKNVTDEEVRQRAKPILDNLTIRPAKEPIDAETIAEAQHTNLSTQAWMLLKDINEKPFQKLSTRVKELRISARKAMEAKDELIRKQLIKEMRIRLGAQRPVSLFEITAQGKDRLKQAGEETKKWDWVGHVGLKHAFYQALIAKAYREKGWTAKMEAAQGNRRFDVLASDGDTKVGIEVELSENDLRNKLDNLDGINELIIVSEGELLKRIEKRVKEGGENGKVKVQGVMELVNQLKDSIGLRPHGRKASRGNKASQGPEGNKPGTNTEAEG